VVGYGTGMTVGRLLALESVDEVVVAELSTGVLDGAVHFEEFNGGVLEDPKTRIVRSDAYRALLRSEGRYDVIVSEPSNPWVTGVEMLYSEEFFRAVLSRLSPGGVFVQWFHTYEMDEETTALVFETFRSVFHRNAVWYGRGADLLIVGFRDEDAAVDLEVVEERWGRSDYREQLAQIGIDSLPQLLAHELVPVGVLSEAQLPREVHTIAHPVLSHRAALAFFRGEGALLPDLVTPNGIAQGRRTSLIAQYRSKYGLSEVDRLAIAKGVCSSRLEPCATFLAQWQAEVPDSPGLANLLEAARSNPDYQRTVTPQVQGVLALLFDSDGAPIPDDRVGFADHVYRRYYHYGAPFSEEAVERVQTACAQAEGCGR